MMKGVWGVHLPAACPLKRWSRPPALFEKFEGELVGWLVGGWVSWLVGWFGYRLVWLVGLVWSGLVWSGLVWSGLVWSGLVWSGLVWSGLVWSGRVGSGRVGSGRVGSGRVGRAGGRAGGRASERASWFSNVKKVMMILFHYVARS